MFWKEPERWERKLAQRRGERAHRLLFPLPALVTSTLKGNPCCAIQACNRWNGVYDYPRPKQPWSALFTSYEAYKERLAKRGFMELGSGYYSSVWGKPGCDKVVKVCHNADSDPYPLFAAWAHANPSPFVPVIHSFKRHQGFYVVVLERMKETVSANFESGLPDATRVLQQYVRRPDANPVEQAIQSAVLNLFPGIRPVLDAMRAEFTGHADWDMHAGNWMIREDGSLVITDPISHLHNTSKASSVKRLKRLSVS